MKCVLKHAENGAREGAVLIAKHIIRVADAAFDDFAGSGDAELGRRMPGLDL